MPPSIAAPQARPQSKRPPSPDAAKPEPKILHQKFFKSVGPRTYAAQLKEAGNGNHFLVITEGKRDPKTGEVRKTKLHVYSEDFTAFFNLMREAADGIRANPLPDEIRRKRENFWKRQAPSSASNAGGTPRAATRDAKPPLSQLRNAVPSRRYSNPPPSPARTAGPVTQSNRSVASSTAAARTGATSASAPPARTVPASTLPSRPRAQSTPPARTDAPRSIAQPTATARTVAAPSSATQAPPNRPPQKWSGARRPDQRNDRQANAAIDTRPNRAAT